MDYHAITLHSHMVYLCRLLTWDCPLSQRLPSDAEFLPSPPHSLACPSPISVSRSRYTFLFARGCRDLVQRVSVYTALSAVESCKRPCIGVVSPQLLGLRLAYLPHVFFTISLVDLVLVAGLWQVCSFPRFHWCMELAVRFGPMYAAHLL